MEAAATPLVYRVTTTAEYDGSHIFGHSYPDRRAEMGAAAGRYRRRGHRHAVTAGVPGPPRLAVPGGRRLSLFLLLPRSGAACRNAGRRRLRRLGRPRNRGDRGV